MESQQKFRDDPITIQEVRESWLQTEAGTKPLAEEHGTDEVESYLQVSMSQMNLRMQKIQGILEAQNLNPDIMAKLSEQFQKFGKEYEVCVNTNRFLFEQLLVSY